MPSPVLSKAEYGRIRPRPCPQEEQIARSLRLACKTWEPEEEAGGGGRVVEKLKGMYLQEMRAA